MKRLFCHFAQRSQNPSGLLSRHIDNCPECQKFHTQVSSMESRLAIVPGEIDTDLCCQIMARVSLREHKAPAPPKWNWISSPIVFSSATALILGLIAIPVVSHFNQPNRVASQAENSVEPTTPAAPAETPEMNLAYTLEQQALLQRDALKLGAHLRENLIIFRKTD